MAERTWQVPAVVSATTTDPYLARAGTVYESRLRAIVAAAEGGPELDWATRVCSGIDHDRAAKRAQILQACGVDWGNDGGYYGMLEPEAPEGAVVIAIMHQDRDGQLGQWQGSAWEATPQPPDGAPYLVIDDPDMLADLLTSLPSLMVPADPVAHLPSDVAPSLFAAAPPPSADDGGATPDESDDGNTPVYAIVDDLDSSAVLNIIKVEQGPDGPQVLIRQGGSWQPDDGKLLAKLTGVDPPAVVELSLPDQIESVLQQVDDYDVKHPEKTTAQPVVADAGPDYGDGIMVALTPHPNVCAGLAVLNGLPADELHLTLAYLGRVSDMEVSPYRIAEVVATWANGHPPLGGEVSGVGTFYGEETPVTYASADVVGLNEARADLVRALADAGIPVSSDHGFTPHITLAYGDEPDVSQIGNLPLQFNDVLVSYGTSDYRLPLGQIPVLEPQWEERPVLAYANPGRPEHSMMPENLKRYWTRGSGALKIRWGVHGDFNRCRHHLAKYLHPNQLAGACAQLHKAATGFWPGPKAPG